MILASLLFAVGGGCAEAEVSGACAAPWPDAGGDAVYVRAGEDGDGSADAPYGELQAAVDAAAGAGILHVLVAEGTYGALELGREHDGLVVEGACADGVVIDAAGGPFGVTSLGGFETEVTLAALTVTGGQGYGVQVRQGTLVLRDAVVRDNVGVGAAVWEEQLYDSVLVAERTRFTGGLAIPSGCRDLGYRIDEGCQGQGLDVSLGGQARLVDAEISDNTHIGLLQTGGSVEMTGGAVTGTWAPDTDFVTAGVVISAATATLTGVRVEGNEAVGVDARDGASVTLEDAEVTGSLHEGRWGYGIGLRAQDDGTIEVAGGRVGALEGAGVQASTGGRLTLSGLRIADVDTVPESDGGVGIQVLDGGEVVAEDVTIEDTVGLGALVDGEGSWLVARALTVRGTVPAPALTSAWAVDVGDGGAAWLEDVSLHDNDQGIRAWDERGDPVTLHVAGGRIVGPAGDGLHNALMVYDATAVVTDLSVEDAAGVGVFVYGEDARAELFRVDVSGTRTGGGAYGYGLTVEGGASATARDCTFADSAHFNVLAMNSALAIDGGAVRDARFGPTYTLAAGVAASRSVVTLDGTALSGGDGPGLLSTDGASVTCVDCTFDDHAGAAALALSGDLVLEGGRVGPSRPHGAFGGTGNGVVALGRDGSAGLSLTDTVVEAQPYAAVYVAGDGAFLVEGGDLAAGGESEVLPGWVAGGNAVVAVGLPDDALRMEGTAIHGATDAALLLDASVATLAEVAWSDNALDLAQQRCEGVGAVVGDAGQAEICAEDWATHAVHTLEVSVLLEEVPPE